jgi:hypothetical protein
MFVPIFAFGLLWSLMYTYFVTRAGMPVLGYAFGTAVLINASQFEIVGVKLLGGLINQFIVLALVLRYAMPRVCRWLGSTGGQSEEFCAVAVVPHRSKSDLTRLASSGQ